jgi:hypothetical protein
MSMTDLTTLALPAWAVPTGSRRSVIYEHDIAIREQWWHGVIRARGLPGMLPTGSTLTRAQVWGPADDVFTLLWRTLAWGSGRYLRQNARRLDAIAADVTRAEKLLSKAMTESRCDPAAAYAVLRPTDRNAIRSLGPSFFTKFLYFAGGGAPEHPCLILDRRVATTLRDHCGWTSLHRWGPWPAQTYQRYCALLSRWAQDQRCAADELEFALFNGAPKEQS